MNTIKTVICGISGGVDSAVSAFLLKNKGFNVIGAFMTNWDAIDEGVECSITTDREYAKYVCSKLNIPFKEVNFVKEYWNDVFQSIIRDYEMGLTPNPDILCNKHIKFHLFAKWALENQGADALATGHYATTSRGDFLENITAPLGLFRPKDLVKDQTFWLSQVPTVGLERCMFPLGSILKPDVKKLAQEIGLSRIALRKESMGICFIGKRRFKEFIDSYIPPKKGVFKLLGGDKIVGEHSGIHHFTLGQRVSAWGAEVPHYIAELDFDTQDIYLAPTNSHPALYMKTIYTSHPHWFSPLSNDLLANGKVAELDFQWQNKWRAISSLIEKKDDGLTIHLSEPMRCVAPGQYAVFYQGRECLGSALINNSLSLWEENQRNPVHWNMSDYERVYG